MNNQRRPLDLLVTGACPPYVSSRLESLGASTMTFATDSITGVIKRPEKVAISAQAIVIDGQGYGADEANAVQRAASLALDLRSLPNYSLQPTGTRWKNTPIFVLVRDDGLVEALRRYRVPAIGLSSLLDWKSIYARIDEASFLYELAVLEDMRSLGVQFFEEKGRVIRKSPPIFKRRNGTLPEVETELYDLRGDVALADRGRSWWARDVALLYREGIEHDLRDADKILHIDCPERDIQRLLERGSHWSEATRHELFRHPHINDAAYNPERIPDIVVRRAEDYSIEIRELKTRQMKAVSIGRYPAPTGNLLRGVSQTLTYGRELVAPENQPRVRRVFGVSPDPSRVRKILIAGDTRGLGAEELARHRSMITGEVTWMGVNEKIEQTVTRLTA